MTWSRAFRKLFAAEGQKAEDAVDSHTDPTISLELSIAEAQKNAESLKASAAKVLADRELANSRLTRAQRSQSEAENNARAALANENKLRAAGDNAGADKAHQQAVLMATQVASARDAVETAKHTLELADQNASVAKQRIDEEMEALQELMSRRGEIQMKIDAAKMEQAMNDSMANLTSARNTVIPSLDQVEEKADTMMAEAHATSDVQSADPGVVSLDIHHQAIVNKADDILAELGGTASDAK